MNIAISKKHKKSQEPMVIAASFRDNSHLYDSSIYAQVRQASHHLCEADDYSVTERTVLLVESAEERVHRGRRRDFAQRPGNTESNITRDIGVQERLPQSFDRSRTIFYQGLARPTLCLRTTESRDNVSQKGRIFSLAGSSQRLLDHRDGGVFPDQFAQVTGKFGIINFSHEAGSFHPTCGSIGSWVCDQFAEGSHGDFTDFRVSMVQQTLDRRSLDSWIRAFQVRSHNGNRIFLEDSADHVDRFRLDFAIFVLEQSHYFLQFFGIRARGKKFQRPTSD